MSVSAKFYVSKIEGQQVNMYPVCRGVENRQWASATPGGNLLMVISNPDALAQFTAGEEYEVLFTHAAKPLPGDGHQVRAIEQTAQTDGKTYYVCETCGSYASLSEDGTPDWTRHEEIFGGR